MADNDTAALVVALSAQLTKFEKDMKGAVDIADRRTKEIETRFSAMNSAITGKLQQLGAAASSNLGFAGTLLNTLGPAGVAAAVGIGAVVGGVLALANAAQEFSEKSARLKEAAETAGLTITQFKLLGQVGRTVGVDFDETSNFFQQFVFRLAELQKTGSGPLFDALLKVDSGLLRQLSTTKDSAKAIDLLIAAYARLDNAADKLQLSRAAGGKGGASGGRILDAAAERGGLAGIEANSPKIDEGQVQRAAALRKEIDAIAAKTANIWGGMFSDAILNNQKQAVLELQSISQWIEKIVDAKGRAARVGNPLGAEADDLIKEKNALEAQIKAIDERKSQEDEHLKYLKGWGATQQQIDAEIPGLKGLNDTYDSIGKRLKEINDQLDRMRSQNGGLLPSAAGDTAPRVLGDRARREGISGPAEEGPTKASATVELAILQKNIALLGEAATGSELLKLKKLELAAAAEKGGLMDGVATRALEAFRVSTVLAASATRERLGIATEAQIVEARLAQLSQDRAKFGLTENEVDRAKVVILREAKEAADALTVRQAYLPGLKQLELDAQNTRKSLDTLAVNSLNNLENSLVDFANGTKTASEAFKAMANSIISDLARIAIRQSITGPIAGALGGLIGGGGGGVFPGAHSDIGFNADGTNNWRGGPTWVGEEGPEIVDLPRGARVIPNDVARRGAAGGAIIVNINNSPTFAPGMTGTDVAAMNAMMQENNAQLRNQVQTDLRTAIRNDADTLTR